MGCEASERIIFRPMLGGNFKLAAMESSTLCVAEKPGTMAVAESGKSNRMESHRCWAAACMTESIRQKVNSSGCQLRVVTFVVLLIYY